MKRSLPTRHFAAKAATHVLAGALMCALPQTALGFPVPAPRQQAPAPIERRPPQPRAESASGNPSAQPGNGQHHLPRGEHLAEWMNQHSNLSPQQQQQALEHEPGFRDLPQDTQQRMRSRLAQLDAMNPQQRQRLLARNEAIERLNPDQRAEVRGAMSQLGSLPADQRRVVAHTFRELRDLPPEQRISAYTSGRYGAPLSDTQRKVLFDLLRIEPMLPPPNSNTAAPPQDMR